LKKDYDDIIKPLKSRISYLEKGAFTRLKNENKKLRAQNKEVHFENERLLCLCKKKQETSESNVFYQIMLEKSDKEEVVE
jgi:hypothetical protein